MLIIETGGVITKHSNGFPKWIFLMNVPAGVCAIIAIMLAWPRSSRSLLITKTSLRHIDYFGALLLLSGSLLLVFALEQAGSMTYAWSSPLIVTTLTVSALCWVGFALWIWFLTTKHSTSSIKPILSTRLFTSRVMAFTLL